MKNGQRLRRRENEAEQHSAETRASTVEEMTDGEASGKRIADRGDGVMLVVVMQSGGKAISEEGNPVQQQKTFPDYQPKRQISAGRRATFNNPFASLLPNRLYGQGHHRRGIVTGREYARAPVRRKKDYTLPENRQRKNTTLKTRTDYRGRLKAAKAKIMLKK